MENVLKCKIYCDAITSKKKQEKVPYQSLMDILFKGKSRKLGGSTGVLK